MAEVLSEFLGTTKIDLDIHGFDAAGARGNLDALLHFDDADESLAEIVHQGRC